MNTIKRGPFIVTVRVSRWFRFRVWTACMFLRLAGLWMPSGVVLADSRVPLTDEQIQQLQGEATGRDHTLQ